MWGKRLWHFWIAAAVVLSLVLPRPAGSQQSAISQRMGVRHWSGQAVAPVYEGFDINPDGTYNLWFGYMNRNFEEEIDLPVGPNNMMEPGGDRGQPAHFAPRRHKDVFKVVVPKDFGAQKIVWKLTRGTETASIAATINPAWQIDRRRTTRGGNDDAVDSNTPPVVTVQPMSQTVALNAKTTLSVTATDDGLPRRRRLFAPTTVDPTTYAVPLARGAGPGGPSAGGGRGGPADNPGLSFEWFKYRGPGKVTFDPVGGMFVAGRLQATATFDRPGEYMLQVVVDDGSGELAGNFGYHCCWTNAEVKVTVQDASTR